MANLPKIRFAVGTFDSWQQLGNAQNDLRQHGLARDSFNCLALQRIFTRKPIVAHFREPAIVQEFAFPDSSERISGTSGPLADYLAQRLSSGARTLKDALSPWLLPRHAAHLQEAIDSGKILLSIELCDADDERWAYRSLVAHSSNSIGIHDFSGSV